MENNWLVVLGFVLVATAGGLGFVAFWHPTGFRENLGLPLAVLTAVAFIVLSFWNLGALNARSEALLNAVKVQDHTASATVSSLAESIRDTHLLEVYGLVIGIAIIAYLLLLSRLPELGFVRKRGEPSTDEPASKRGDWP